LSLGSGLRREEGSRRRWEKNLMGADHLSVTDGRDPPAGVQREWADGRGIFVSKQTDKVNTVN